MEQARTHAWLAAARHRLGLVVGGADGAARIAKARAWAEAESIVAPEKVFALRCPWPG